MLDLRTCHHEHMSEMTSFSRVALSLVLTHQSSVGTQPQASIHEERAQVLRTQKKMSIYEKNIVSKCMNETLLPPREQRKGQSASCHLGMFMWKSEAISQCRVVFPLIMGWWAVPLKK